MHSGVRVWLWVLGGAGLLGLGGAPMARAVRAPVLTRRYRTGALAAPSITTAFATTDSHVVWGGFYTDYANGTGSPSSGAAREFTSQGAEFDVRFSGTQITMGCIGQGDNLTYTVDGGTPTTYAPSGSWHTDTLATGLANTTHTLRVQTSASNLGTFFDKNTFLSVTAPAPALSLPSGFTSNTNLFPGTDTRFQVDGSQGTATATHNPNSLVSSIANGSFKGHGQLRFLATCTAVNFWMFNGGDIVHLLVDDDTTMGTAKTLPNTGTWGWVTFSGLDGSAQHQYTLVDAKIGSGAGTYLYSVIPGGGSINSAALTARNTWAFYGDSITDGSVILEYAENFPELLVPRRQIGAYVSGIGGSSVENSYSGTSAGETRYADITGLSPAPTKLVILYGHNDANNATYNASNFLTSYGNMLTHLLAGIPAGCQTYCLGILNTTATNASANRTSCNTQIQSAVTANGDSRLHYVSTDGWITPASDTSDGVHPNASGGSKIATQLNSAIP